MASQGEAGRVVSPVAQGVHPCLGWCQGEQPPYFMHKKGISEPGLVGSSYKRTAVHPSHPIVRRDMPVWAMGKIVFGVQALIQQASAFWWCCSGTASMEEDFILPVVMITMSGLGQSLYHQISSVCPARDLWEMCSFQSTAFRAKAVVGEYSLGVAGFLFVLPFLHSCASLDIRRTYCGVSFVT